MVVVGRPRSGLEIVGETPAGLVDGVNRAFQTAFRIRTGTLRVFLNGVRLAAEDYAADVNQVLFDSAPRAGDELTFDYYR
jgi:hypothetical protein